MSTYENLKYYANKRGLSLIQLSKKAGMSENALYRYNQGVDPKLKTLEKLAAILNIPISQLSEKYKDKDYIPKNAIPYDPTEMVKVPILGEIACGSPILAKQNIEGYLPISLQDLPKGNNFWLKCSGNSMSPTIHNGALVLIHQQPEVESGEIAAVLLNDNETTLKRVQYHDNQVILVPDNKDSEYNQIILNEDNPGKIIGKAIKVQFDL